MLTRRTGQLRLSQALTSEHVIIRQISQILYELGLKDEDASVGIFRWEKLSLFEEYIPQYEIRLKRQAGTVREKIDNLTLKKGLSPEISYLLSWRRKYEHTMGWPLGFPISDAVKAWVNQIPPFDGELP